MSMPVTPDPQQAVESLRLTLTAIVNALLQGSKHARWYADYMDEDIDRALAPALVRKGAKRFLLEEGQSVQNEEDVEPPDFETEYLPNLGLAIASGAYNIRVLRSDRGLLPVPGVSKRRRAFYAQQGTFNFDGNETSNAEDAAALRINLVLHWSTDDDYNLDRVYLACPKAGGTTRASVEAYWDEPIWRRIDPALSVGAQVEAIASDLEIYIEGTATGTGE